MIIKSSVIELINNSIGKNKNESGGIIGSKDNVITDYIYDRECKKDEYIPNVIWLNREIKKWGNYGVRFEGMIHSHNSNEKLSYADIEYARKIIRMNEIKKIHMFLYILTEKKLIDYVVKESNIIADKLTVI